MDRRSFLASSTALGAVALAPAVRAQAQPGSVVDAALAARFDQIFQAFLQRSPEFATQLGLDKGENAALKHRLSDRSAAARARALAQTRAAISSLKAIDPDALSPASKLDREVVLYSLEAQTVAPERFGLDSVIRPFTIFQQGGAYFSLPDFLNSTHVVATTDDAEAYLDRLNGFATALDQETAVQKDEAARGVVAPDFSLDLTLGQMAALREPAPGQSGLVASLARRAAEKGIAGDWAARAEKVVTDRVYPALDRQIALVKQLRAHARTGAGVWELPDGEAIYAAALKQATTTDYTPEQVHRMGLEQVAEITARLDTILKAQGMTQGTVGDRLTALNAMPAQLYPDTDAGRDALLADLNQGVASMVARLPRAFNDPPNKPLEIRRVPVDIQDGASNGYYRRAALDGSRPAIYFINLKSVADWPRFTLPSLTYHEAVPGHHHQISIAQGAEGPLLRKVSFFGAYTEGWALYAEQLADELGGYANPLEQAGYLQSFLFRAARLVVDTGIHVKRWSRDQATDYLVQTVGFARPRSQREVERYCTQPGQACSYKIGHTTWVNARERAKKIAGDRFDLKQFHEVLRQGIVPLTILDRLVDVNARAMAAPSNNA